MKKWLKDNKLLVIIFIILLCFILYSNTNNKKDIKNIYKNIEGWKREEIIKDSMISDSLITMRDLQLDTIMRTIYELSVRQKQSYKKINKKYEDKINYLSSTSNDSTRSIFGRNFSKKIN